MLLHSLSFPNGGHYQLTFDKPQGWLRTTWTGYISTQDALAGARDYLTQVGPYHCLYLLNDNTALRGPWFDSTEWLEQAWLPQAIQLGLRYIAHVVQTDTHCDSITLNCPDPVADILEMQLFGHVAAAEEWLRSCQRPRQSAAGHYVPLP